MRELDLKKVKSMTKPRIGYIGVGLMGHGAASNILKQGYQLNVLGNRNRKPIDDLVAAGAQESKTPAEITQNSDIVFTCLPSSVEVERIVYSENGLMDNLKAGLILVDSTTADPNSTRRIGADLEKLGCFMVDAPVGRTPREAEMGKLNTFLGGQPEIIARVKPVIACYADTIIEVGSLGMGHTMKLLNNFISIGNSAIIAEATATAAKLGVDLQKFYEVVSSGGANSAMFQMVMPWVLEGDDTKLKGPIRIASKDMRFYCRMAETAPAPSFIAQSVNQVYQLANVQGHGDRFMPTLAGILAGLNGVKLRDLP